MRREQFFFADDLVVAEHRRQQNEVEWKGILNTISSLLSAEAPPSGDGHMIEPTVPAITQALQARVANAREMQEVRRMNLISSR